MNSRKVMSMSASFDNNAEPLARSLVIIDRLDDITTIGINQPEKRNCLNHATAKKLIEAFAEFEADDNARVAVLYGIGDTFCAGYDLKETAENDPSVIETLATSDNFNPFNEKGAGPLGPTRRFFAKPVIAAISGYAVAGGLELALACDLRVVENTAIMGVFCRRFGVPLIDGGTVRLPALIGLSRALDIILTGRAVEAKEALEIGLATRVVESGTALHEAIQLAREISRFPQQCLLKDRQNAYHSTYSSPSFQEAVEYEMENSISVIAQESIKGASSFVSGVGRHGSFNVNGIKSIKKSKL